MTQTQQLYAAMPTQVRIGEAVRLRLWTHDGHEVTGITEPRWFVLVGRHAHGLVVENDEGHRAVVPFSAIHEVRIHESAWDRAQDEVYGRVVRTGLETDERRAVVALLKASGWFGMEGGWIYSPSSLRRGRLAPGVKPVTQGWAQAAGGVRSWGHVRFVNDGRYLRAYWA